MSRAIRPKPWETSGTTISGAAASSFAVESVPPSSTTAKHLNNPHINRSAPLQQQDSTLNIIPSANTSSIPSTSSTQTQSSSIQNSTSTPQPSSSNVLVPTHEPYQTSVQPYSMYGNNYGMYGNSMYSPYGGMYGGGGYGSYGGYGFGTPGMMGGPNWGMNFMQTSVDHVGRFSSLLQMASQALHMTFSSFVQLAGGLAMIIREFGGFFSGLHLLRFFKYLIKKLRNLWLWISRQKPPVDEQMEELFSSSQPNTNNTPIQGDKPNPVTMGFYAFGFLCLIQWIWSTVKREIHNQQQQSHAQSQSQLQSTNPLTMATPGQYHQPMPMMSYMM